jgi:branched-chain amino acid transport system substrate-binding protein
MSDVAFDGVTGKVAFDEYGDTTSRVLTVYGVDGGAWKPVATEEFK